MKKPSNQHIIRSNTGNHFVNTRTITVAGRPVKVASNKDVSVVSSKIRNKYGKALDNLKNR